MSRRLALVTNGFQALRQSPLQSLLSILGLVIGVAALVAILSLVDGIEQYARQQIEQETDFQTIGVVPIRTDNVDGITIRRESIPFVSLADVENLAAELGEEEATVVVAQRRAYELPIDTTRTAAMLVGTSTSSWDIPGLELKAGRLFDQQDEANAAPVVVLSDVLAKRLAGDADTETVIGDTLTFGDHQVSVIGVLEEAERGAMAIGPYTALADSTSDQPPSMLVRVEQAENVPLVAENIRTWLDDRYEQGREAFSIQTNERLTEQLRQGILLFKLIMGMITGISVLVGGVGVMNVLLMTVTERTKEIGVRKATGARRRDIVFQFLSEAIVISSVGSFLGLLFGLGFVFAATPIIKSISEVPFSAAFTFGTLMVVAIVAVLVGVIFGTYPAYRAAKLSPVDAIRHE